LRVRVEPAAREVVHHVVGRHELGCSTASEAGDSLGAARRDGRFDVRASDERSTGALEDVSVEASVVLRPGVAGLLAVDREGDERRGIEG
jgi:hypothetical protein